MYHKDRRMLQRLIIELDDSRSLYSDLGRMLRSPHPKYVVERTVLAHRAIAEDLAEHMCMIGTQTVRRGSMLGKLRARYGAWRTTAGAGAELNCLIRIQRREAEVVERFFATAEQVPGLQQRLYRHLGELECISVQVTSTLNEVDTRSSRVALRAAGPPGGYPAHSAEVVRKAVTTRPRTNHNTHSIRNSDLSWGFRRGVRDTTHSTDPVLPPGT